MKWRICIRPRLKIEDKHYEIITKPTHRNNATSHERSPHALWLYGGRIPRRMAGSAQGKRHQKCRHWTNGDKAVDCQDSAARCPGGDTQPGHTPDVRPSQPPTATATGLPGLCAGCARVRLCA